MFFVRGYFIYAVICQRMNSLAAGECVDFCIQQVYYRRLITPTEMGASMEQDRPTNHADFHPGLKKIRQRRLLLWAVIFGYLPAMMIALNSANYRTWVTVAFVGWIVSLIAVVVVVCIVRCPRCGEYFHTNGPTFLPLRRCLHCTLHVKADKRPPEPGQPLTSDP